MSLYTKTEGSDYAQRTSFVNIIENTLISEDMRTICYDQEIYEDLSVELDEYVGLTLSVDVYFTAIRTLVEPNHSQASILILDNDSE